MSLPVSDIETPLSAKASEIVSDLLRRKANDCRTVLSRRDCEREGGWAPTRQIELERGGKLRSFLSGSKRVTTAESFYGFLIASAIASHPLNGPERRARQPLTRYRTRRAAPPKPTATARAAVKTIQPRRKSHEAGNRRPLEPLRRSIPVAKGQRIPGARDPGFAIAIGPGIDDAARHVWKWSLYRGKAERYSYLVEGVWSPIDYADEKEARAVAWAMLMRTLDPNWPPEAGDVLEDMYDGSAP
jgi:hypothetical protein